MRKQEKGKNIARKREGVVAVVISSASSPPKGLYQDICCAVLYRVSHPIIHRGFSA